MWLTAKKATTFKRWSLTQHFVRTAIDNRHFWNAQTGLGRNQTTHACGEKHSCPAPQPLVPGSAIRLRGVHFLGVLRLSLGPAPPVRALFFSCWLTGRSPKLKKVRKRHAATTHGSICTCFCGQVPSYPLRGRLYRLLELVASGSGILRICLSLRFRYSDPNGSDFVGGGVRAHACHSSCKHAGRVNPANMLEDRRW